MLGGIDRVLEPLDRLTPAERQMTLTPSITMNGPVADQST